MRVDLPFSFATLLASLHLIRPGLGGNRQSLADTLHTLNPHGTLFGSTEEWERVEATVSRARETYLKRKDVPTFVEALVCHKKASRRKAKIKELKKVASGETPMYEIDHSTNLFDTSFEQPYASRGPPVRLLRTASEHAIEQEAEEDFEHDPRRSYKSYLHLRREEYVREKAARLVTKLAARQAVENAQGRRRIFDGDPFNGFHERRQPPQEPEDESE